MSKLTIKDIEVPAHVSAAVQSWWNTSGDVQEMVRSGSTLSLVLAALRVGLLEIAENPIVPAEWDLDSMSDGFLSDENKEFDQILFGIIEWQRRMFLSMEHLLPEALVPIINPLGKGRQCERRDAIAGIMAAYKAGREAK